MTFSFHFIITELTKLFSIRLLLVQYRIFFPCTLETVEE